MANSVTKKCEQVLQLLSRSRNVLISGAPGTGKSKLLAEVALAFEEGFGIAGKKGAPQLSPRNGIPIPPSSGGAHKDIPSPERANRKVFRTVFHQNSKYRDFVAGIVPAVNKKDGEPDFTIVAGTLYRASEHANAEDGASLLIIDEINRGPAVQVFGDTIVAIESDKRLAPDGSRAAQTQFFELLDPASGDSMEYALPHHLYILAAMNQADASVEPLDVAFLRRWEPLRLEPEEQILREFYGISSSHASSLPQTPESPSDVFEASVRAWKAVNEQIALGRGDEFQIGHGILISEIDPADMQLNDALNFVCVGWSKIRAHVAEVFFGDARGVAATLNALDGPSYNPFKLIETTFAEDLRVKLQSPANFTEENIYPSLRAFARE